MTREDAAANTIFVLRTFNELTAAFSEVRVSAERLSTVNSSAEPAVIATVDIPNELAKALSAKRFADRRVLTDATSK